MTLRDHILAIGGLTDDVYVTDVRQQGGDAIAKERVVIGDQNANWGHAHSIV